MNCILSAAVRTVCPYKFGPFRLDAQKRLPLREPGRASHDLTPRLVTTAFHSVSKVMLCFVPYGQTVVPRRLHRREWRGLARRA
ncbi:MAG: hypothetical protein M3R15_13565 [Acidobacteriota bacterium]|nr:hypothetical protein [Acidobacteriota bacterium]